MAAPASARHTFGVLWNIAVARVILDDPEARKYVAAIGYHVYPYGSPYASVPRILHASGSGRPDPQSIEERRELRDPCRRFGVPAWMTEMSHGEVKILGSVTGEQSREHVRWQALEPFAVESSSCLRTCVPGMSVTTFAVELTSKKG